MVNARYGATPAGLANDQAGQPFGILKVGIDYRKGDTTGGECKIWRNTGRVDIMDELTVAVGLAGGIISILTAVVAYRKGLQREGYRAGSREGNLQRDIDYIKRRTDEMLLEQKDITRSINRLAERITRVEESAKQAHKRLDQHLRDER